MNIKDAVKSIIRSHDKDRLAPLTTVWGEDLTRKISDSREHASTSGSLAGHVLPEYPRPQFQRDSFLSLNGFWDYAITDTDTVPDSFDGQILVPFSPECTLSGVNRQLLPSQYLWYRRSLSHLPGQNPGTASSLRTILHFGAVDYRAQVYVNGRLAATHRGGYLPFQVDITGFLKGNLPAQDAPAGDSWAEGENELLVRVEDPTQQGGQPRGKQSLHRGGIFYTAQSGIWQTVWLEQVPASHLEKVWFETDYDHRRVIAHISAAAEGEIPPLCLSVLCGEKELIRQSLSLCTGGAQDARSPVLPRPETAQASAEEACRPSGEGPRLWDADLSFTIPEEDFHSWSPQTPFLYQVSLSFGKDRVQSYFAMRLYTIESPEGTPVFCLNHSPCFLMGVLDQGYWPDGLYTAPSEEALLYDITVMKKLGFNMLRKHIKVENARWYYHCDRLGMIVCQDMVNGGGRYRSPIVSYLPTLSCGFTSRLKDSRYDLLAMENTGHRRMWERECLETVDYLKFFPSIAIWTAFNEGWGQFDAARITGLIRKKDPSRLIDSASGWFDQGCGDFISVHNYFRPLTVPRRDPAVSGRAIPGRKTSAPAKGVPGRNSSAPGKGVPGRKSPASGKGVPRRKASTQDKNSFRSKFASPGKEVSARKSPAPGAAPSPWQDIPGQGGRAAFLSEYGGYACHIKEHSSLERIFGYKRYDSLDDFVQAYRKLTEKSLLPLREQGLSGAVYTQLSDVEEEVNGLLTYDRKINKLFSRDEQRER